MKNDINEVFRILDEATEDMRNPPPHEDMNLKTSLTGAEIEGIYDNIVSAMKILEGISDE